MDWVFEASSCSWDYTDEFDVLVMEKKENTEDFSGILEDYEKHSTMAMASPSPPPPPSEPPGSSKKPRGHGDDVSCLVDGCRADLSSCRKYHRRHRVCEPHSKTPVVTIRGKHQRFCQQCSRFHSVGEFDEVKRSCRKRLDGHNKRRRKPRGEDVSVSSMYLNNNYQSFFTTHQGTKLLRFGDSPAYKWPNKEKSKQQLSSSSSSSSLKTREKKFPFLLGRDSDANNAAALSLLSNNNTSQTSFMAPADYVTGLNLNSSSYPNNHNHNHNQLIGMIRFRTQGLENEAPQILSFSWGE